MLSQLSVVTQSKNSTSDTLIQPPPSVPIYQVQRCRTNKINNHLIMPYHAKVFKALTCHDHSDFLKVATLDESNAVKHDSQPTKAYSVTYAVS